VKNIGLGIKKNSIYKEHTVKWQCKTVNWYILLTDQKLWLSVKKLIVWHFFGVVYNIDVIGKVVSYIMS